MIPNHHLPADWVIAYAAGTLEPAEYIVAATHLTLCPVCREAVRVAEAVGARALAQAAPVSLPPGTLDSLLARLDDPEPTRPTGDASRAGAAPITPAFDPTGLLPGPLYALAGPVEQLKWRWLAPFIQGVDLPVPTRGLPLRIVRMSAGASLPHRHVGTEVGLILQGGWTDQYGQVARGDLAIVDDEEAVHQQHIDRDGPCIALVLNAAPGVPANPLVALIGKYLFKV